MSNLTDQSVQLVLTHMDKLAAKLGIGAGEIFSWYVKQIWIDFYVQIVWILILTIVTIIFGAIVKVCKKDEKEKFAKMSETEKDYIKKEDWTTSDVLLIPTCIFGLIGVVVILVTLMGTIPQLLNINYHAFNDLIGRLASTL